MRAIKSDEVSGFENLFRDSPLGIIVSATTGELVDANETVARLLQFTRAEMIGHTTVELGLLPAAVSEKTRELLLSQGFVRDQELVLTLRSGERRDVIVSVQSVELDGVPRFVTTVADVTERRRADESHRVALERFSRFLEAAPDAIVIADAAGRIVLVNAQTEVLFGYRRAELLGQAVELLIPARVRERHTAHRAGYLASPAARPMGSGRDLAGVRRDGTEFPVEISLSPLESEGEALVCASIRDMSERRRWQLQLELASRLASLGTLAAGVAHEVNNPLAVITLNTTIVENQLRKLLTNPPGQPGPAGPWGLQETLECVADIQSATDRIGRIVGDLQVFARPAVRPSNGVSVPEAIAWAARMAGHELKHRALLVTDLRPVPSIAGDEHKVGQVLVNLLVNAAHAIPPGRVSENEVRVSTWLDASGQVVIEVRDSGHGIPDEIRGRIFDPFFTTRAVGSGTGLGLSICHGIVSAMGGRIEIEAGGQPGTAVRVWFPAVAQPVVAAAVAAPTQSVQRSRVLAVDDDEPILRSIKRALPEADVVCATSADEALGRLASGDGFEVILIDVMMPEITGIELYGELVRRFPDAAQRVVFMSGGITDPAAAAFLDSIPNERLAKPFTAQELGDLIQRVVSRATPPV